MREGVDYSGGRPTAAAMKAAGKSFVIRYVSSPGGVPKDIGAAEAAYWRANGIDIGIVFEDAAGRAVVGGKAGGTADARTALAGVKAAGGPADGGVIYVACDIDVSTGGQLGALGDYLGGWSTVIPRARLGIYGEFEVVKHCLDQRWCAYGWQTYGWSGGQWDPRAQLQQYRNRQTLGGVAVDLVRAPAVSWGAWPKPPPKPAAPPAPAVVGIGGTMPILRYGMRDPIAFKGGQYVSRLQLLVQPFGAGGALAVDGVYGDQTAAAVQSFYLQLLGRTTDGRTVDGPGWERLIGCQ